MTCALISSLGEVHLQIAGVIDMIQMWGLRGKAWDVQESRVTLPGSPSTKG